MFFFELNLYWRSSLQGVATRLRLAAPPKKKNYSISIMSCKMINKRSTTFLSRRLLRRHARCILGFYNNKKREIIIICSYVFLFIQSLFCSIKTTNKHRRIVVQRCILGFYNDKKERLYYLFLCFSFHSISLLFHENINETSTTFLSAIHFGFTKREKREIIIICSYVFLWIQSLFCSTETTIE